MLIIFPFLIFLPILRSIPLNVTIDTSMAYTGMGSVGSAPPSGTPGYLATLRRDYKFRLADAGDPAKALAGLETYWPGYYQIDIKVEPCSNHTLTGGRGATCCSSTGEVNCQDHDSIHAGVDMQIAYLQNAHISTCINTDFADDPNCGTFIEVHRADNGLDTQELTDSVAEVLASVGLTTSTGAYQTAYVSTSGLCAGDFQLWWVVRTRSGPYVQFQKGFEVLSPTCEEEESEVV